MSRSARQRLLLAVALTVVLGGVLVAAAGIFAALPSLLAFLPLLAGRYIGIDRLERLIAQRAGDRGARGALAPRPRPLARPVFFPRGGRLLATSLAKRPPPAALTA